VDKQEEQQRMESTKQEGQESSQQNAVQQNGQQSPQQEGIPSTSEQAGEESGQRRLESMQKESTQQCKEGHATKKLVGAMTEEQILKALVEFQTLNDPLLEFPCQLNSDQRYYIHDQASKMGFSSKSTGYLDKRYITIYRKKPDEKERKKPWAKKTTKKEKKIPSGMSEILPEFLYLGSGLDARDLTMLRQNKISRILNVAKSWANYHTKKFKFFNAHLEDQVDEDLSKSFEGAFTFIETARTDKARVLVHWQCYWQIKKCLFGYCLYHEVPKQIAEGKFCFCQKKERIDST